MTQHQPSLSGTHPLQPGPGLHVEVRSCRGLMGRWAFLSLALVFATAFVSLRVSGGTHDWLEDAYRSIGLFAANTDWGFERTAPGLPGAGRLVNANMLYRVLAVLAPILTAAGVVELTTGKVGHVLAYLWVLAQMYLLSWRGVGIFGLTEQSYRFAADIRASKRKDFEHCPVFIVTNHPDASLAERCEAAGIVLYAPRAASFDRWLAGKPRSARTAAGYLASLGRWLHPRFAAAEVTDAHARAGGRPAPLPIILRRAHTIVSFLPDIGQQVGLAAKLGREWSPKLAPDKGGLELIQPRLYLLTADRGLTQPLEDRLVLAADSRPPAEVQPRLLDAHTLAARRLLTHHPFDVYADAFGHTRIHLAIYGLGTLGRSIVKQAAQLYVTRPSLGGVQLHVSVFDQRGEAALEALLAENPGIDKVISIDVLPAMTILPGGLTEAQVTSVRATDVTGHILAFRDPHLAFTTALSLRRWLLQPPANLDTGWRRAHALAPIFAPCPDWTRIDSLYSTVHDGISGYGARNDGLAPEDIIDDAREHGAMAVHAAYMEHLPSERLDRTQFDSGTETCDGKRNPAGRPAYVEWRKLTSALRDSNFHAYDHLAIKARAIGYRVTPVSKDDPPHAASCPDAWPPADAESLHDLERLEHLRYMAERQASSWRTAPRRFDPARVHPDLVDWAGLSLAEQKLDSIQIDALPRIAKAAGKRLAPAFVVGVAGYCDPPRGLDQKAVKTWLFETLEKLRAEKPQRLTVLLTSLARSTDCWAAAAAITLKIPFIVPLPLPYELYREDFDRDQLIEFHKLIASAECFFELPNRFGAASELTRRHVPLPHTNRDDPNLVNRNRQYALAGAYILERADEMLYVTGPDVPGEIPRIGSAGFVHRWHQTGLIDQEYRTPCHFFPRPDHHGKGIVFPEVWAKDGSILTPAQKDFASARLAG